MDVIREIEAVGSMSGRSSQKVKIIDCGPLISTSPATAATATPK